VLISQLAEGIRAQLDRQSIGGYDFAVSFLPM
jgi:hypothetical protein